MITSRRNGLSTLIVLASTAGASSTASAQALRLLASSDIPDLEVLTTTEVPVMASFSNLASPVTGIGIIAQYTGIRVDNSDGLGPWSLDARITATSPDGQQSTWNPIGGDFTIADYPLSDATDATTSQQPNGEWTFSFGSIQPDSRWTYGIEQASIHLLTEAAAVTETTSVTPDSNLQWSRPFFIEGVSGLGPVTYHAREFSVSVSGLYEFESVLNQTDDHFAFLYRGSFDPTLPLENLLDYGLGNGNSPFGIPRGTSAFSALLIEGETYIWVTSQWDRFGPIITASNTVMGPGSLIEPTTCLADVNQDGDLNGLDFGAWLNAFNSLDSRADQNQDGAINGIDFGAWLSNFNAGCDG